MSYSTSKSSNTPYIKIGDSFNVPIQLVDVTTGLPVEITNAMTITSTIVNLLGEEIAIPTVTPQYSRFTLEYVGSNEWVVYK